MDIDTDPRTRRLALAVLCTATLMIILDGTIVTVALPTIQSSLHFSPTALTWVVNAYLIAFGSLLLLAGRLGDLLGRKRVLLAGLALFTAASLLCGLATSSAMLIAARFAQGVGGAMVSAVALGMVVALYPDARQRAGALAVFSFVGAGGATLGLLVGGVLTQGLGWHWIFFVNLPLGLATGAAAVRLLPAEPGIGMRAGADAFGAVLVSGGLMLGIYAIVADRRAAVPALLLLAGFAVRQFKAAVPLLPPRVFASRSVSAVSSAQLLVIGAAMGFQVLTTIYLQRVLGFGPAATGLAFAPTAVVIGAVALGAAARLIARFGARAVLLTGLALIAAGLVLLTAVPAHGGYGVHVLPALLIFGLGGGLTLPALATLGMAGATPDDAGLVSGVFNTGQQLGGAIGVAVLSSAAAARTSSLSRAGEATATALTGGYHLAFGIGAGMSATAIVLVMLILRPAARSAQPASDRNVPEQHGAPGDHVTPEDDVAPEAQGAPKEHGERLEREAVGRDLRA